MSGRVRLYYSPLRQASHLEPGQHELLGREVGGAQLVVGDEGPDQAQDQLQVAVVDVGVT